MDPILILAVVLFIASAFLIVAEVFVPSGGLISIAALVCLIGGLWIFFNQGHTLGWIGVGVALVLFPIVLITSYKLFPKTRFGKSVTLTPPQQQSGDGIEETKKLQTLLNKKGKVISPLRPVGTVDFEGKRVECLAESGYISKDTDVTVIKIQGTQVTVREI